jgi:hypothetical protein
MQNGTMLVFMTWSKYASKCWSASKYLDPNAALTKVKEWFLFKIQGLTLNKSFSLVCRLQTLFWIKSQIILEVYQTDVTSLNLLLFSALRIF